MNKTFLLFGASFACLAVILGALGAHWLRSKVDQGILTTDNLLSFETGVKYQIYHGIALILVAILFEKTGSPQLNSAGWLFIAGTICFSFSIYFLATKGLTGLNVRFLGPITPIGGLLLISGWIMMIISFLKK